MEIIQVKSDLRCYFPAVFCPLLSRPVGCCYAFNLKLMGIILIWQGGESNANIVGENIAGNPKVVVKHKRERVCLSFVHCSEFHEDYDASKGVSMAPDQTGDPILEAPGLPYPQEKERALQWRSGLKTGIKSLGDFPDRCDQIASRPPNKQRISFLPSSIRQ